MKRFDWQEDTSPSKFVYQELGSTGDGSIERLEETNNKLRTTVSLLMGILVEKGMLTESEIMNLVGELYLR